MTESDIQADLTNLAFGLWDEPREAEPAHGLLMRVLALNGQTRTASAAFQVDVNGRDLKPDQCLDLMLRHPMAGAGDLVRDTPVVTDRTVTLRGHAFRRRDWSIEFRRFCPGCLAESAHHRNWWDLQFMITCPFHGVRLDGGRPDARRVRWSQTDLAWSGGDMLVQPVARLGQPPRSFEAYVLGRLGLTNPFEVPLLDPLPLDVLPTAIQEIGRLAVGGWRERRPRTGRGKGGLDAAGITASGFRMLAGGELEIHAFLRGIMADCPVPYDDPRGEIGITRMFGWAYFKFGQADNALLNRIAGWMVDIAIEDGRVRRRSRTLRGREHALGRLTLKEAGRELGVSRKSITALVERTLPGFDRERIGARVHLSEEDIATVREAMRTALDRKALAQMLSLRPGDIRGIEEAGLIARCEGIGGRARGTRFLLEDARRLIDHVAAVDTVKVGGSGVMVGFRTYAKLKGMSRSDLAAAVLDGSVRLAGRSQPDGGFEGLAFEVATERLARARLGGRAHAYRARVGLSLGDAALRLRTWHPTVTELIRTGYLREHAADRTGTGTRRVDERSLAAFEEAFVAAKDLAEALGCRPFGVTRRLRRHGIRPILKEGRPEDFTVYVRRSEVEERLGLRTAPCGGSRPDPFWEDARNAVLATCPAMQLGAGAPRPETVVWNSKRSARVAVAVREGILSLAMDCAAGSRRLERAAGRRDTLERGGIEWVEEGSGVRLVAYYEGFDPATPAARKEAARWLADRLAIIQAVFGSG